MVDYCLNMARRFADVGRGVAAERDRKMPRGAVGGGDCGWLGQTAGWRQRRTGLRVRGGATGPRSHRHERRWRLAAEGQYAGSEDLTATAACEDGKQFLSACFPLGGRQAGASKGGGWALLVWKAATCRHGGQDGRLAATEGRRDPGGMADVAASGRLPGARCGVCFLAALCARRQHTRDRAGSDGWRAGVVNEGPCFSTDTAYLFSLERA